ncbi:WxL protein peptidoglycan domain-containing protein [Cellulomonas soli]|uniref:DUF916 domain-containing protein n=1 Tax=Cellulomonas soli TaxID=931535 RepID=A0A512PF31_9CELL|nr:DUF916 domain-containing protein [Cellulomonas soli]NYI59425.1 uncharacterized membrane protein YhaH (DUF805 family) [Cellulomonas soli]GEP69783.1 hypothetical protein CSO01_24980 [Cellulomonas soli]
MSRPLRSAVRAALVVLAALAVVVPATAAGADDGTAAWSITPSDAAGTTDGRTRFELSLAPGEQVEEHLVLANSSTVERTFRVYGADGFNTATGGFDLRPAADTPVGIGAWVTTPDASVTVPALSTRTVAFTVAVPQDAAPGDHAGGLVVSPEQVQVDEATGVVVDTRVAVRLAVRVAGELAPALEVRDVHASYAFDAVPFAASSATVTFEVVNTGNVKVLGVPRLRVTGPFGTRLAHLEPESTREVLPGDSFTVTATLPGVEPAVLATAVVDVTMAAAPGPGTELPGVSSTGRATFVAVPWTGLLLVAVLVVLVVLLVRRVRARRRAAQVLWTEAVAEARREIEAGPPAGEPSPEGSRPSVGPTVGVLVLLVLVVTGAACVAVPARAVASEGVTVVSQDGDDGVLRLEVPASPTASPSVPAGAGAGPGSAPTTSVLGGSRGAPRSAGSPPAAAGSAADAAVDAGAATGTAAAEGGEVKVAGLRVRTPDLVWRAARGDAPARAVLAATGLTALGGGGWLVHRLVLARRPGMP